MKLDLIRTYGIASTSGQLFVDGVFQCFTLERPFNNGANQRGINAILPGTYKVVIAFSPKFSRDMPKLEGVPGRDSILIHWGNTIKDSEGCILVGKAQGPDMVLNSRAAFADLYPRILGAWSRNTRDITITIR